MSPVSFRFTATAVLSSRLGGQTRRFRAPAANWRLFKYETCSVDGKPFFHPKKPGFAHARSRERVRMSPGNSPKVLKNCAANLDL